MEKVAEEDSEKEGEDKKTVEEESDEEEIELFEINEDDLRKEHVKVCAYYTLFQVYCWLSVVFVCCWIMETNDSEIYWCHYDSS